MDWLCDKKTGYSAPIAMVLPLLFTGFLIEAINDALIVAMIKDERVMGEDVGRNGGVFRATNGLLDRFGEERVVDTPLAEAGIVGTAIGLAT